MLDIPVNANERLRLRLLNAARDRLLTVRIDRHAATVVAIDGQPAEPFPARDSRVVLPPGNRVDLFIDATLAPDSIAPIFVGLDDREAPLARLVYGSAPPARARARTEVKPLPENPLPQRMNFAAAIKLEVAFDDPRHRPAPGGFGRPLFTTAPRQTVMIGFKNTTNQAHVVHLHGHSARLLDTLDDGWKPYWLDTILAPPQRTTRIAFVADNRGKWLIESQDPARRTRNPDLVRGDLATDSCCEEPPVDRRQRFGQIFGDQPRPRFVSGLAVEPGACAGSLERRHVLGKQPCNHPRQHVARPRGRKPWRRVLVDGGAAVRRRHDGVRPFEQDNRAGGFARPASPEPILMLHQMFEKFH